MGTTTTDIKKVNLTVCYDDYELHEVLPFTVGIWRFSDVDNLDDLAHLEKDGITRPLIERYGKSVLSIDLDEEHMNVDTRQRLQEIYKAMPVSDTGICQLRTDGFSASLNIYGDNVLAAIDKLVAMGVVDELIGESLSLAFHKTIELDNLAAPDGAAARDGAVERAQPVSKTTTLNRE